MQAFSRTKRWLGIAFGIAAIVVLRSFVWVWWEQSYFDSDQAIVGLMAKHLLEARAFPLVFYGQHHMLAVESWVTAPVFALFGASVLTLKLPLVAINIAVALLLVKILVAEVGLTAPAALAASLFFVLPPPITASRLVEAQGGNIEPFLFVLLLWLTRRRPVAFGLIAGVGIMQREFTAYAVAALLAVELWRGRLLTIRNLRDKAIVFGEIAGVVFAVRWLKNYADLVGPGTAGTLPPEILDAQPAFWTSLFCWNPAALVPNVRWLFSENLSALFGWRIGPLSDYVNSPLVAGHWWTLEPLAAIAVLAGVAAIAPVSRAARQRPSEPDGAARPASPPPAGAAEFPLYLVLIGAQAIAVYALLSCLVQDRMLVRYTLLALLIPVGVVAWLLRSGGRLVRRVAIAATLVWAAGAAIDTARLLGEYVRDPPASEYRQLADLLEREGIKYAIAPYWTAYQLDFLTAERLTVASYEKVRIEAYQDIVGRHENESSTIYFDNPCGPGADGLNFRRWCVGFFSRARHAR